MSRSTASKPSGGSKSEKRSQESKNDSGIDVDISPDEVSVDVGVVEISLDVGGEASLGIEIPTPVPGVTALGGIVIDTKTGEIVEVSGGVEIANVTGVEVAISGCDILTTFYVEIPGTGIRFSYDVEGELPNCKEEESGEEEPPPEPGTLEPRGPSLEEIRSELITRNAEFARVTWAITRTITYRFTGNVQNPREITDLKWEIGIPSDQIEIGFNPGRIRFNPTSSNVFEILLPNGFTWRRRTENSKRINFSGGYTEIEYRLEQLWWSRQRGFINASFNMIKLSDNNAGQSSGISRISNPAAQLNEFSLRDYPDSMLAEYLNNPVYYPFYKLEIYEQEEAIFKPKPITSPPRPPRKMDKCCRESLILLEEIHESLGCEELLDKKSKTGGFEVPRRLLAPGGKGELKHHDYLGIFESVIRIQDNLGFHPFQVNIKDTNAAAAGDQSVNLKFVSLSAALEKILYLLIDTEDDGDAHTNMLVRLAFTCVNILTTLATTSRDVETIRDGLGIGIKAKREFIDTAFDVTCGQNEQGGFDKKKKEEIDKNMEESTEAMLPYLLQIKRHAIKTTEFDDKDDIKDLLVKILYSLKGNS